MLQWLPFRHLCQIKYPLPISNRPASTNKAIDCVMSMGSSIVFFWYELDVSFESTTRVVCDVTEPSRFDGKPQLRYEIITISGCASGWGSLHVHWRVQ